MPDDGYQVMGAGYWVPGTGCQVLGAGCQGCTPGRSSCWAPTPTVHPETASSAPNKTSCRCFHSPGKFLAHSMFSFSFWQPPASFSTFICSTLFPCERRCLLAALADVLSLQTVTPFSWCGPKRGRGDGGCCTSRHRWCTPGIVHNTLFPEHSTMEQAASPCVTTGSSCLAADAAGATSHSPVAPPGTQRQGQLPAPRGGARLVQSCRLSP